MATRLTLVHAMSPLHAGTGQSVGTIDLPIARERPTGIPLVPGSSIKGALRARCEDLQWRRDIFGPEMTGASEHSGSVQFSDVHLLLLPVRSIAGTFAWVTSRYLVQRFLRTAGEAGARPGTVPAPPQPEGCLILSETLRVAVGDDRKVVLEDLDLKPSVETGKASPLRAFTDFLGRALFPTQSANFEEWRSSLSNRICLVHDDVMSILLETATEVTARIRLAEDTKTVAKGALWYQEALPSESVLAGLAVAADVKAVNNRSERKAAELLDHVASLTAGLVQLGGKATVGQGSCLVRVTEGLL